MYKLLWVLALWLGALPAMAQRLTWEHPLDFVGAPLDVFGYAQILDGGDILTYGVTSPGRNYPLILARYHSNGMLVRQQQGRILFSLEQALVPLGAAGFLLAASAPEPNSRPAAASLFFQRLRPNGDTLPGHRYARALLEGYPVRAVRDGDSVRVLAVAYNATQFGNQTALVTTDTAGTLGSIRRYPLPVPGTAYAGDMVRTARGTWLLLSEFPPVGGYTRPNLLEVDARGLLLRQRVHVLFPTGEDERVRRISNNLIRLSDGSGYVFGGWHDVGPQRWGFLCKLDTALNVVWTYRHPPQATSSFDPTRVYEQPDGTLSWLVGDGAVAVTGQPLTNKLYFVRVSAGGQLLGQRTFSSAACTKLRLYSWQPLTGGGALVVGYSDCGTPGSSVTYTARFDSAAVLASRPAPLAGGGAQLYPNPATAEATWQGAVPQGAGPAELVLHDVLGRAVRRVAVAGRGEAVAQVLDLRGLPPGAYSCRLLLGGQPRGGASRLLVGP